MYFVKLRACIEVVEQLRHSEGCPESSDDIPKADGIRDRLWLLFEYPESSKAAFVVGIISVIIINVSIRIIVILIPSTTMIPDVISCSCR